MKPGFRRFLIVDCGAGLQRAAAEIGCYSDEAGREFLLLADRRLPEARPDRMPDYDPALAACRF